jgi:hypothetical protein
LRLEARSGQEKIAQRIGGVVDVDRRRLALDQHARAGAVRRLGHHGDHHAQCHDNNKGLDGNRPTALQNREEVAQRRRLLLGDS